MKAINYNILLVLLAACMASCSDTEQEPQPDEAPVVADLAFTVSRAVSEVTRMSDAIVQKEGQAYRGIDIRHIIPFAVEGQIGVNDKPKLFQLTETGEKPVNARAYYYYEGCNLMTGVASFLSYGRAPVETEDKAVNGSVVESFPLDFAPKNTRFSLEAISERVVNANAEGLAYYMTNIANATANGTKWANTGNGILKIVYQNFINQTGTASDGGILPGSATNIKAYTQALKTTLNNLTLTNDNDIALRTAIIDKIDNTYNSTWDGFPASIGLPDGAAVIRWINNSESFEPQISNTSVADINGIDRFAYPAELYYYGNSQIMTSNIDKRRNAYTDEEWSAVLAQYEFIDGKVSTNTTAVAIKEPLQYGVARMQMRLKMTNATLRDSKDYDVTVGATNFPLTGVIVGGQLPVGFDFKPTTTYPAYSEADMKYIYDNQLPELYLSSTADAAKTTNTLVLQSYDNKKVPVVLEFINNSSVDFQGLDGIVYRGTKFYLVAEVDPTGQGSGAYANRLFTQDYTTVLNMRVTGLEKAYNVVPNLLSPRLEMGVELVSKWVSTTPEEVLF